MGRYHFSSEQRKLLEGLAQPLGIYQFLNERVVTVVLSNGFCDLFGYKTREQAYAGMENNMYRYTHPDDVARIAEAAYRFATENEAYDIIYRSRTKYSADYRIVHAVGKHVCTDDGVRLAHVWYTDEGAFTDETPEKRTELNRALDSALREESLVRRSNYDYLTGLPNMTRFFDLAKEGIQALKSEGKNPVLLYIDLCGMKFFNSQNSFAEGDNLLREFARVLKRTFGDRNCCRVGSDHFAAYTEESGLEDVLKWFFRECKKTNEGNNLPVRVGIYANRVEDVPVSTACDRAKFACDSLQDTYAFCYAHYTSNMLTKARQRRHILANLDRALDEKWIQVFYQPIVRAVNGRVCDEEALSRWFDPELGLLSPVDFIPVLENAGMIYKLDLYVLDQALMKMRLQQEAGLPIVPCSINLSRSDFTGRDIVEIIRERVDAAGIGHDKIVIEITESAIGRDVAFMKRQMQRFQKLGFRVWMDDFGSGYSSVDLLQTMDFDLVKFDMSFMQQLDEGDAAKIVLTELVKMATSLGADTLCEGVETKEQVQFLQEIGCSKLQGYYYNKPTSFEGILDRYKRGIQIGFENPEEASYYETVGRVNLYDLSMVAKEEKAELWNYFDVLPMAIMELDDDCITLMRANRSYREFVQRYVGVNVAVGDRVQPSMPAGGDASFIRLVQQCCERGGRAFADDTLPDGISFRSFVRHIATNPITGKKAAAIALLSVTNDNEGATYAGIARALAADYHNIYYVDLDTNRFIEYSSEPGNEELVVERLGTDFFASTKHDAVTRVYEKDRERFLASFTKENVVRELDEQGVFRATFRLIENGKPTYASLKVTRMHAGANQLIMGVSIVDSQMKQQERFARMQREQDVLRGIMALSGSDYLSMYSIDPTTGHYHEYKVAEACESLGYGKGGGDFFAQTALDAPRVVCAEDLAGFLRWCTKDNILAMVEEHGSCTYSYRLNMQGQPCPVTLKIAKVQESDGVRLVAGVRLWQTRHPSSNL